MKVEKQASADLTRLGHLLEDLSVAMLTTRDASGHMVSRPMAALAMDEHGALWFFTDVRSGKLDNLLNANLSFADPQRACYVSLSGHGEISMDRPRIERLWTPFAKPWFPHGPASPDLALLKFVSSSAEFWDAPNSKMVRMFAMAASVVAARPIGLGEHDTLNHLAVV